MRLTIEQDLIKNIMGIYQIVYMPTGRMYVGSTNNLLKRYRQHLHKLSKGDHLCTPLQNAYAKHGPDLFEFQVLETIADKTTLIEREQYYIDTFKSHANENGFNVCKMAGRPPGIDTETAVRIGVEIRGREFTIESPDGRIVNAKGVKPFAREHGLDAAQLLKVLQGKQRQVRGWRLPGIELPKSQTILNPLGEEVVIPYLGTKQFARQHGLTANSLSIMMRGEVDHYKGYTRLDLKDKMFVTLISPLGERFLCSTVRRNLFRARHGLKCGVGLGNLIRGKTKSHLGWIKETT
jgi:predicted GIY-YIG superfamily endonuclease